MTSSDDVWAAARVWKASLALLFCYGLAGGTVWDDQKGGRPWFSLAATSSVLFHGEELWHIGQEKQRLMRPDESSQPPTMTQERAAGESQSRALTLVDDKGRQVLVPPAVLRVGGAAPSLVDHAGDARALEVRGLG